MLIDAIAMCFLQRKAWGIALLAVRENDKLCLQTRFAKGHPMTYCMIRSAVLGALAISIAFTPRLASGQQRASGALPDWSGVWQMVGPTVFDTSTVEPPNGRAGDPGVRERPPYNDEWEARYRKNVDSIQKGVFPDPVNLCGTPHGFPRVLNLPDVYEFVVRPEQVWIIGENGPNILRIYTDGRKHPAPEDLWPTYTGDSVGHWENDTLVVDTISAKGAIDGDVIVDRTGLILSEAMHVVTRMKKVDDSTIEAQIVIEDSKALKSPWRVTKRYRRLPADTRVYDYSCAENNRNPVTPSGRTLTLGPDGKPIDRVVD